MLASDKFKEEDAPNATASVQGDEFFALQKYQCR
jgi:hypothetical protein